MRHCEAGRCAIFNEVGFDIADTVLKVGIVPKKWSIWLDENHYRKTPHRVWWDFSFYDRSMVDDC